jgi:hypothetical protein
MEKPLWQRPMRETIKVNKSSSVMGCDGFSIYLTHPETKLSVFCKFGFCAYNPSQNPSQCPNSLHIIIKGVKSKNVDNTNV